MRRPRLSQQAVRRWKSGAWKELAGQSIVVRSASELPAEIQQKIEEILTAQAIAPLTIRFEKAPSLGWGLELRANGRKIAWSAEGYVDALEERLRDALEKKTGEVAQIGGIMSEKPNSLHTVLEEALGAIDRAAEQESACPALQEYGEVVSIAQGITRVSGLPHVQSEEVVRFSGDVPGIAFNLDPDEVGVFLLDHGNELMAGSEVRRTGHSLEVPVGEGLLGRVVDPWAVPSTTAATCPWLPARPSNAKLRPSSTALRSPSRWPPESK